MITKLPKVSSTFRQQYNAFVLKDADEFHILHQSLTLTNVALPDADVVLVNVPVYTRAPILSSEIFIQKVI